MQIRWFISSTESTPTYLVSSFLDKAHILFITQCLANNQEKQQTVTALFHEARVTIPWSSFLFHPFYALIIVRYATLGLFSLLTFQVLKNRFEWTILISDFLIKADKCQGQENPYDAAFVNGGYFFSGDESCSLCICTQVLSLPTLIWREKKLAS